MKQLRPLEYLSADRLSAQLGKTITTSNLRVMLHRARDQFAHILLDEVRNTLDQPARADLEEELIELSLLKYCRPFRRARDVSPPLDRRRVGVVMKLILTPLAHF